MDTAENNTISGVIASAELMGSIRPVRIDLEPGFSGFAAGTVNAEFAQHVALDLYKAHTHQRIASMTFNGKGQRQQMVNPFGHHQWSFGPVNFPTYMLVMIAHQREETGQWRLSKMVGPLVVKKFSEGSVHNVTFYQSTVISEDYKDESHDDCTLQILQYKEDAPPSEIRK